MSDFSYSLSDPQEFASLEGKLAELEQTGTLLKYNVRILKDDKTKAGQKVVLEEKKTGIKNYFKHLFDKSYNINHSVQTLLQAMQANKPQLRNSVTSSVLNSLNVICENVNKKRWLFKVNTAAIVSLQKEEAASFFKTEKDPAKLKAWLQKAIHSRIELGVDFIEKVIIPGLGADSPIKKRYEQLKVQMSLGQFEKTQLSEASILQFALFCEECTKIQARGQQFLRTQITGLQRPVLVDWLQRQVYILSDSRASSLQARGGFKNVTNAVRAPLETTAQHAAEVAVAAVTSEPQENVQKELAFHDALKGIRGISEVYTVTHITKALVNGLRPPIVLMYKKAHQGSLQSLFKAGKRDAFNAKKGVHDLVDSMKEMHARHVVHLDLKEGNILLDKDGNILVTDFGFSFFSNGPELRDNYAGNRNYYGAKWYSAPELLFRDPNLPKFGTTASERDYQVAESFTVGCILYNFYFKSPPPWSTEILNHVKNNGYAAHMTNRENARIIKQMEATIEKPLSKLPKTSEERTEEQHYQYAILQMMRMNPLERWTPADVQNYLNKHVQPPQ